ncbi:hypothetical protein RRG08_025583 [Elysia crispata]|uniref:Uncharacterized protein n=1 Tax=Elysia crispata TaxID=231223 RepID=A0AAE0YE04_9GAST|nr:hypothetical protein RRG08_025583 [Elysia crispata]
MEKSRKPKLSHQRALHHNFRFLQGDPSAILPKTAHLSREILRFHKANVGDLSWNQIELDSPVNGRSVLLLTSSSTKSWWSCA